MGQRSLKVQGNLHYKLLKKKLSLFDIKLIKTIVFTIIIIILKFVLK